MSAAARGPAAGARAALCLVLCSIAAGAQASAARWAAGSRTALSITGDLIVTRDRIIFQNGASLAVTPARPVPAFLVRTAASPGARAALLYRIDPPADPVLLHGNHLCGGAGRREPVTFLATWDVPAVGGGRPWRMMAAFSGPAEPTGDDGACATYAYVPR